LVAVALALAMICQSTSTVTATDETSGPVFGGTFSWTTPLLASLPPVANGFLGVASFRGRFIAVGRNRLAATSSDGATWVGHPLPGPTEDLTDAQIAAGADRVVILGQGAAWVSTDGDVWASASVPPFGTSRPTAIAAHGDGFTAVGVAAGGRRAVAWATKDGSAWSPIADQPAFDHFCPRAVTTAPTGRIVAVGDDCYPYLARPAAAISDDGGLTWVRAPAQTSLSEQGLLSSIVAGASGLFAVGSITRDVFPGWPQGVAMFVSSDGVAWRRVGYFAGADGGHNAPLINAVPGGFLVVAPGKADTRAFVSIDGTRWTTSASLPATPHAQDGDFADVMYGVAVSATTVVAVGTTDHVLFVDESILRAFTLVGALTPRPAVTGPIPVPPAIPIPRVTPAPPQPTFPGSISWAVLALPVDVPPGATVSYSTVRDVARWRGGYAAIGEVRFTSVIDGSFIPGSEVVWTSPDGRTWTVHQLPPACVNGRAISATGTAIAVAGDSAICRSPDGTKWTRATDVPHAIKGFTDLITSTSGFVLAMAYPQSGSVSVKVWRSIDGLHWRTAGHPSAFKDLRPRALASSSRGIVFIGQRNVPGSGYQAADTPVRSPDAITWSRGLRQRVFQPASFEAEGASMIGGGPGYLAAGAYQPRSRVGAAVWTSIDGVAWKRAFVVMPDSGFVEFDGIARVGPGYAVAGLLAPRSQEDPATPMLWLSPDGSRWRSGVSLPMPANGPGSWLDIAGLAGGSTSVVAVGNRYDDKGASAAQVWTGRYGARAWGPRR
jgi:hypothetical protein